MPHLIVPIVVFLFLEGINTAVNILPARRLPTPQARKAAYIRAGLINLLLLVALVAYIARHT